MGSPNGSLRIFFASATTVVTDHLPFGEGLIAWHLLSGLADRGHTVVACADGADLQQRPSFELVLLPDAQRFESIGPYTRPYAIGRAFERRGGSDAFDIVHWLFPQSEDIYLPRTEQPCRTVVGPLPFAWSATDREHGLRAGDLVRVPLRPLLRRRHSRELAGADVLLASLPEVKAALPPADAARAHVVGFGIDAVRYDVRPLPPVPRITFVGRLIENKGIRTLYSAFRTLAAERPNVELALYGDGSLRSWLEQKRASDGLHRRVHLPGAVPHGEVARVLAECSVLCLPSNGEPFGMVILEAMAAGRPVVAVNRGGPAHLLQDGVGGLLVEPDDPAALAGALGRVLDDPVRASAMGHHNRLKAETTLSWDTIMDDLERIYRSPIDAATSRESDDGNSKGVPGSTRTGLRRARSAIERRIPPRRAALARRDTRTYEAGIARALSDPVAGQAFSSSRPLPPHWGRGTSERIVEFPWVVAALKNIRAGLTLDAGSTLNHGYVLDHVLPVVRALHVVTLAPEPESFPERGVSYLYADLRDLPLRERLYDTVVCLSTLEHVGMDVSGYGARVAVEVNPQQAAVDAARELRRVVKPGGRIFFSVPFGRPDNLGWLRQLDEPSLRDLIAAFGPADVQISIYRYANDAWQLSSVADAAGSPSQPYWATAVACVAMTPR